MGAMFAAGDGWRHGWVGVPGVGKSIAAITSLRWALDNQAADVALILDDKGRRAQYPGCYRVNVAQLRAHPPAADEDVGQIVFRGVAARCVLPGDGSVVGCDAEAVAAYAWELALSPAEPRVIVVLDELLRAVKPNSLVWHGDQLRRLFSDGRGVGLSVMWSTQIMAKVPTEAVDLGTIGVFRLAGRSLDYVFEVLRIRDTRLRALIENLPRFQFVVLDGDTGWDGHVYQFPAAG
jgi:hypothetical protein